MEGGVCVNEATAHATASVRVENPHSERTMAAQMNGGQKAAILLLSLGEEAAAEVIRHLSEDEINALTGHMNRCDGTTPAKVERVANEFYRIAEKGRFLPATPETKTAYLKKILARALGEEKSAALTEGMLASQPSGPLEKLRWHDPATIAEFICGEHPQVIAVIAANLGDPALTQQVLFELPDGLREDVIARLLRLREILPEWVEEIEASLADEMEPAAAEGEAGAAPSDRVAGMLNAAPKEMESSILHHIQDKNPELAGRIRERMFPFEDFIKVDNFGMQKVLERVTNEELVLALRTAGDALRRHFLRNLSAENAHALEQAMEEMGPIRVSAIETAQKRLSNIARELARQGELSILEKKKN